MVAPVAAASAPVAQKPKIPEVQPPRVDLTKVLPKLFSFTRGVDTTFGARPVSFQKPKKLTDTPDVQSKAPSQLTEKMTEPSALFWIRAIKAAKEQVDEANLDFYVQIDEEDRSIFFADMIGSYRSILTPDEFDFVKTHCKGLGIKMQKAVQEVEDDDDEHPVAEADEKKQPATHKVEEKKPVSFEDLCDDEDDQDIVQAAREILEADPAKDTFSLRNDLGVTSVTLLTEGELKAIEDLCQSRNVYLDYYY